jgi:hypothetical protein
MSSDDYLNSGSSRSGREKDGVRERANGTDDLSESKIAQRKGGKSTIHGLWNAAAMLT